MKALAISAIVILAPWSATAQSTPKPDQLPMITIKPSDSILFTPVSGDEWSEKEVEYRSITRIEDLQSQSPNLVARSGGTRSLNLVLGFRGLVNNAFYGEPAVALYVDDVPYGTTLSYDTSLLDYNRVELLRGPQFTRWGRHGPGGLIAVYAEPPGEKLGAQAQVSFASHDEQTYQLRIDGPITQTLSFTLSGGYSRRDGYLYNELTKMRPDYEEGFSGRFSLQWQASDKLQVKFIASSQHFDDGVQRFTNLDDTPYRIDHDFIGVTRTRSDLQSLQFHYEGDDLRFTSITARRNFRIDPGSFDLDFTPQPILPLSVISEQVNYTQEFRWEPKSKSALDWFIGAYASHADLDVKVDDNVFVGDSNLTDKTLALYGEITRKFDNKVDVTLGLRGEVVENSADRALLQPDGTTTYQSVEKTVSNLSPKLGVTWHLSDKVFVYGTTSLSYRPGAYSLFNFEPQILTSDTERTWANEIGAKARLLDNELEISLAGFWYEIEDYQIERYVLGGFGVFTADQVASRGAELEVIWRPTNELEFSAGIGYVDAEFTNHRDALTGENLDGRRAPYIPSFTGHFAAQYRHGSGFLARVDWLLTGRTFFDEANTKSAAQSSYGLLNARIGYEQPHWGIYLYGKNLTDAEYYTLKIPTLSVGIPSEPRSIGMMAEVRF